MEPSVQVHNAPANLTLSMIRKFHSEGMYCDVEVQVDTEVFKSQRSLLAGASEYFHAVFVSDFEGTRTDQPIIIPEVDATAFGEILNFMYTGDIRVTDSNVEKLLKASDFLGLRSAHIEEQCIKHVRSRSRKHKPMLNAVDLFVFAFVKAKISLLSILTAHIYQHLRYYLENAEFMEISFECLNALLKCSKNYILPSRGTENVVLQIILSWVNYFPQERSEYRCELMKNINFSYISSDFTLLLINRLANLADAIAVIPSTDAKSLETLKKLKMDMEIEIEMKTYDLNDGDAQSEATITLEVGNVSEMSMDNLVSATCMISNLPWKIVVRRAVETLAFFLECEGTSEVSAWSCCAKADLIIVSQKRETESVVRKIHHHIFSSVYPVWGFPSFISWDNLMDPEEGYIKNNSITFLANVRTDVPLQGIFSGKDSFKLYISE